jgi:predicted DNA-binding protein
MREVRTLRLFENRLRRKIFRPNRGKVTREVTNRHNEELKDLYLSASTVRVIKSGRLRWAGHVVCTGERCVQGFGRET